MLKDSGTRFQLLTGLFLLTLGVIVGVVAVRVWNERDREELAESRRALLRTLNTAVSPGLATLVFEQAPLGLVALNPPDSGGPEEWWEDGQLCLRVLHRDGKHLSGRFEVFLDEKRRRRVLMTVIGVLSPVVLAGILVVGWLGRRWIRPISRFSSKMDEVERGNLDITVREDRQDEIGELARLFNAMLEGVKLAREQSVMLAKKQASIEKFAALGRLSAGVAHEINNPVGGIITCVDTLQEIEPGSEQYHDYLNLVRSGLERIGKIVGQLLRFSRQPAVEHQDVDLNGVLEEVLVLSRFQDREKNIRLIRRFGDLSHIHGAPDLLHQLFLNLVLNSIQAMPDGGTLTLLTWAEEGRVCVSVEDTGPGIPKKHMERIFDPFFTTKAVGVGTGLGLSVALGIAETHSGTIDVENLPVDGVRFTVRLPTEKAGSPDEKELA